VGVKLTRSTQSRHFISNLAGPNNLFSSLNSLLHLLERQLRSSSIHKHNHTGISTPPYTPIPHLRQLHSLSLSLCTSLPLLPTLTRHGRRDFLARPRSLKFYSVHSCAAAVAGEQSAQMRFCGIDGEVDDEEFARCVVRGDLGGVGS
jgi:hypothetical protein